MMLHQGLSTALRGCSSLRSRLVAGILAALVSSAFLVRPVSAELIYGIANQAPATALVSFDSANPSALLTSVFISGLQQNETLLGIDFRPLTGELYGLGSTSRLYKINPNTGQVSSPLGPFQSVPQFTPNLNGFSFGFDFNPMADRIRVVADTNQNLVLNPTTALVQTVSPNVAYGAADPNFGVDPNIVGSAYSNNVANAPSTTLYGIDTGLDILATQVAATGELSTIGPLGLNVSAAGGFDISSTTGIAYTAMLPANSSQSSLYSINLATGAATNLGTIDGGLVITSLAVIIPEPATSVLVFLGVMGAVGVGRRARLN